MGAVEYPLEGLTNPEKNVRVHPENQIMELARGLQNFGQTRPIVADEQGVILVGNGLVAAMERLKWSKGYVIFKEGLSEAEKQKLMIVDNRMFELGVDDKDAVVRFLSEMEDTDVPGFDEQMISNLVAGPEDIDQTIEGYAAPGEETQEQEFNESSMPEPPTAPPEPPPAAAKQVKCPHCGDWVWAK